MSTDDVYALMSQAGELPYGEARTVLVEDALRRAEAAGDEHLAFRVRMELTNAYRYGGEPAKAFATFSRTLADHDRDPARFDQGLSLLWQMKATVSALTAFPEIPLDRTHAVLDDMERRYLAGGHSLQAVYHYRNIVARHVGDLDAADHWYAKWVAAPRDDLSDCAGCDPTGMVEHLKLRGRYEEAFEIAAPVLDAQLNCTEQPHGILTALLEVYLRTGRPEQARDAHRRAYRLHRAQLADLHEIGEHLEFCARTGNHARGLEILQRHLGWLDRAPSPYTAMCFAAAAALVLRRVEEAGHGSATVRRPATADRPAAEVPVPELRAELAELAERLAARFDARNGTSYQGDLIRTTFAADQLLDHLPLTAYDRRPTPAPVPAAPPVPDLAAENDLDALLDAADKRRASDDVPRALAAWRRFDELAETVEPTALQAARRLDARGVEHALQNDHESALEAWQEAFTRFGELGEAELQHRTLSRMGAAHFAQGEEEKGLAELTAAVAYDDAHPAQRGSSTGMRMRLASAHLHRGQAADALPVLDAIRPDGDWEAGEVELLRGQVLLETGDMDGGTAALRRSLEALRASGQGGFEQAQAALLLSRVLNHLAAHSEDAAFLKEALDALDEAVAHAPAGTPLRSGAHLERGTLLLGSERAADAVPDLVEAVAGFTAAGLPGPAVLARVDLAAAYQASGRHLEAAETAEEALPGLEDPADVHRCRLILAHAQQGLGEAEAAETFASLAEDAEPAVAAEMLERSAEVLTGLDMDAQAAERFLEAAGASERAGNSYAVVQNRRRAAMCLLWSGQPDEAVVTVESSRATLAALPADNPEGRTWLTALVSYDQARILAALDRHQEALEHVETAVEGFTALGETGPAETAAGLRDEIRQSSA
ncbi:hypothetical protein [Actinomadura hibisca]|uniref:hypothetical protein n=1 Tax=Actinomadura hibisca TaxID=68565 RepID=UPI000A002497|nr:hypothetical protein [Actinomadura hibisca]